MTASVPAADDPDAPTAEVAPDVPRPRATTSALWVLGGLAVAAALVLPTVLALVPGFRHGLDISDEGLYLVAADAPDPRHNYVGLWGVYLHPLFAATGYDIAAYRALGALLLASAAWLAARAVRRLNAGWRPPAESERAAPIERAAWIVWDGGVVAAALTYYSLYLVTPSYNWLTLVGILLVLAGVLPLLAAETRRWDTLLRCVLVAVGVWLAAMGRPTSGVLLVCAGVLAVTVLSTRPVRARWRAVGVVTVAGVVVVMVHLVVVLGWNDSVESVTRTLYFVNNDATAHGFVALLRGSMTQFGDIPAGILRVAGLSPLAALVVLAAAALPARVRPRALAVLGAGALLLVMLVIASNGGFGGGPRASLTLPYAGFALVLTAIIVWVCAWAVRLAGRRSAREASPSSMITGGPVPDAPWRWAGVATLLLVAAIAYSFSSNNGVVSQLFGGFVLLLLCAGVVLIGAVGRGGLAVVLVAVAVVGGVSGRSSLLRASESGYRTAPPAKSTAAAVVSHRGAELLLGPSYALFFDDLRADADKAGFATGTPLVDLTPFSPGVGYALGAQPPTTLMLGFSVPTARWALDQQDAGRWHDAWLLVSPDGARAIDPAPVVAVLGRSFPGDYVLVTTRTWPFHDQPMQLWRPR